MHARPVIQATSADFDIRENPARFPVAQSPAADWQSCQQLFFAYETSLACRCLVMFGADATVPHVLTARRHDAQKIFRFTIHAKKTLCEAATGRLCHTRRISNTAVTQSVLSICPIASAKQANRFLPDRQWIGIRKGATYRFWTAQALLLVKTRFLRPRNGRG